MYAFVESAGPGRGGLFWGGRGEHIPKKTHTLRLETGVVKQI